MTKQVSARQEDLTNPSHAAILADELEQVISMTSVVSHAYTHAYIRVHTREGGLLSDIATNCQRHDLRC